MTTPQWLSIATLIGMMVLFIWGRFRYDVTACIAFLAAVTIGIVSPEEAFTGFSDDIVIIVGSALVISAAVQRSGVIEVALSFVSKHVRTVRAQLLLLTASVGVASGLVKNVGALAMLMPAAIQMAKKNEASPSVFLMPMAFASLLGGLMTLVGTSPNIIVSRVRQEMTGEPFGMFDYFPTGFGLFIIGLIFLRFGYRLLPRDRRAAPTMGEALDVTGYVTEATISEGSSAAGETVSAFTKRHGLEVTLKTLLRGGKNKPVSPNVKLQEDDVLILSGNPDALERVIATDKLTLEGETREKPEGSERDEVGVIEAVINADSLFVGQTAARLRLQERFGVNLIAISRANERLTKQIGAIRLRAGDVIVLQGPLSLLPERLGELGALPLAERAIRLGASKRGWLPVLILAVAMAATATGLVPVAIAFFAAALPPRGAVALILVAAMAVTPFLNNAATVLVMAPIAAVFAHDLGYRPEAFLIATAVGAGCDFLTPIGHQCNTLVLGPGGYKFSDYARLGAPLSLLVVVFGTALIMWVWPLS